MTKQKNTKIHIIGAGISGLITALVLEENGYSPTIIEASNTVGGRVKTDIINGYQLDHGFQVLLTSYPAAQKYLDYTTLELQKFLPGAVIYKDGKASKLGDPLRDISFLISTIFSDKVTISDKLKINELNSSLKNKSLEAIFSEKEQSTLAYLKAYGFSKKAIDNFFIPFFTGIFLETELATSSRMFEFVYKMFGEGYAALPKNGIGEIPKQLTNKLTTTKFRFNSAVKSIHDTTIQLENGEIIDSNFIIIATDPSQIINFSSTKKNKWKNCQTLYFETTRRQIQQPLIGLVANESSLINNIFYTTALETQNISKKEVLSVTVVKKHNLHEKLLVKEVIKELEELCQIKDVKFLKLYDIQKALPEKESLTYIPTEKEIKINDHTILAGDYLSNGSLNAAMLSGEFAAKTAIKYIDSK
ncbi:FAD-dependent oxidoreductase [Tenacibaculum agarivorans]|uniref:FAD-dependent oxidoreductase n=1 Tax=Tenacibaculum agarivorans TaxID=1908389 RepID=UPI00094B8AA9|nr:FAD-dependent oxidoreductase [Tenacibaculum agarivorans]